MRLKAEKAKKILRQKSQKKLALPDVPEHLDLSIKEASSLKKIVDAKVIPSISSSKVHTFKPFLLSTNRVKSFSCATFPAYLDLQSVLSCVSSA